MAKAFSADDFAMGGKASPEQEAKTRERVAAKLRKRKLAAIYRKTHRDYKGMIDGERTVMVLRNGGSCLVGLDALTDDEIARMLPRDFVA